MKAGDRAIFRNRKRVGCDILSSRIGRGTADRREVQGE
jgi:hypothetical protein